MLGIVVRMRSLRRSSPSRRSRRGGGQEGFASFGDDHAALHRVARIVAQGAEPEAVFAAVAGEAARVLAADIATIDRFDPDEMVTLVAVQGTDAHAPAVWSRTPITETGNAARVRATGRAARVDRHTEQVGSLGYRSGFRAAVSVPILVGGRVWGAMTIASTQHARPFPDGTEERLVAFTELAALGVANAQARHELRAVADEQAALRRVAMSVARGAAPDTVFSAVAEELGRILGADAAYVVRDEGDEKIAVVGGWSSTRAAIANGSHLLASGGLTWRVLQNGAPAHAEAFDGPPGSLDEQLRMSGMRSEIGSPVRVLDRIWGAVIVAAGAPVPLPAGSDRRFEAFTDLVATAIVNAQAHAELTDSRARVVASSDEARRRIERDLHGGAQQRLVALALELRAARQLVQSDDTELVEAFERVGASLEGALEELQELARGIHPAILGRGELEPALRALARRSPLPVELTVELGARLPEQVVATAYFIIAEALTNTAKHARASTSRVEVRDSKGILGIAIRDDGTGGADPSRGSGLLGLRDRAEAAAGTLSISSPPGGGTSIVAELPLVVDRPAG